MSPTLSEVRDMAAHDGRRAQQQHCSSYAEVCAAATLQPKKRLGGQERHEKQAPASQMVATRCSTAASRSGESRAPSAALRGGPAKAPTEPRPPRPVGIDSGNRRRSPRLKELKEKQEEARALTPQGTPASPEAEVQEVAPPSIERQDEAGAFPPPKRLQRTRPLAALTPPFTKRAGTHKRNPISLN